MPPKAKTQVKPDTITKLGPRPRLVRLIIKNFRCIGPNPVTIDLDDIVVLVGPNNTGKSSVLKAYEIIMSEGSGEGELTLEDFPGGKIISEALPEIELHTIVYDNSPGPEWIGKTDSGENLVKERWNWSQPGKPVRRGYNFEKNRWADDGDKEKVPWGAAGYANSRRPQPHRVGAFDSPEKQEEAIVKLLTTAIKERVKTHEKDSKINKESDYAKLLESVAQLQKKIVGESQKEIEAIQDELTTAIERVFPKHQVIFDAKPEDDIDKAINLFKTNPKLLMGPKDGYLSTVDRQGSGARRTLLWTALRLLAESGAKKKSDTEKPHVLLLDEPEICLHPNAIREACSLLYGLPEMINNWQVMVTTHSPCFVDFSRDHTTIVRVEISQQGQVSGTTIFRPANAKFTPDDKLELKMLNICDPYVAEFFFGGRTIVVEGDTEYTAFKALASLVPDKFRDIHIVRARGKATIVSLAKILNQFGKPYAILHDSDRPTYICKNGAVKQNPAWAHNTTIMDIASHAPAGVRVVASVPNFEEAYLNKECKEEKPYNALTRIKSDSGVKNTIEQLLDALVDFTKPLPQGAMQWDNIDNLKKAVDALPAN
jgi:putative ATP-dependent endonuclease of OLD family